MATTETKRCSTTVNTTIVLDGVKRLRVKREITKRSAISSDNENRNVDKSFYEQVFELEEVTKKEIGVYRMNKVPSFVFKVGNKHYYTRIPKNLNLRAKLLYLCADEVLELGKDKKIKLDSFHKCSQCMNVYPVKECEGGCEKVRNKARFIEIYDWIPIGYETFGTDMDVLVVIRCLNYEKYSEKTRRRIKIADEAIYNLLSKISRNSEL